MAAGQVADLYAVLGLRPDQNAWKKGNELVDGLKTSLKWFAGFEAVRGIAETVKSTIDLGGHLDDLRQKTGLSAVSLQQWGFAAKLGGSDMDSVAHATGHLARTIKEAQDGSEEAGKALNQVGLSSKDVTAALKGGAGLDDALIKIADKFASMPDGAQKTALAMGVFGRSGAELIPTLNLGAKGLSELRKEAIDLGAVMSEDTATAADVLGDNIDKVKMSLTGLKNQAVASLLPMLKELVDGLLAWIKVNKGLVIETLTVGVNGLVSAIGFLVDIVGVAVDAFKFLQEHAVLARALLISLGLVITTVAVEAAAAWIIGFWPVIAVVASLTALVLVFDTLLEALLDGKGVFAEVGRFVVYMFNSVIDEIKAVFIAIGDFFQAIGHAIKRSWEVVIDWISAKIDWAMEQLQKVGHYITHPWEIATDVAGALTGAQTIAPQQTIMRQSAFGATQPAVRVDSGDTNVTINALGTSATEVGEIVDTKIKEHHDKVWRDAHAASGGADESDD